MACASMVLSRPEDSPTPAAVAAILDAGPVDWLALGTEFWSDAVVLPTHEMLARAWRRDARLHEILVRNLGQFVVARRCVRAAAAEAEKRHTVWRPRAAAPARRGARRAPRAR